MFSALIKRLPSRHPNKNARRAAPKFLKGFDDQQPNVVPKLDWPWDTSALKELGGVPEPTGLPNGDSRTSSYLDKWNCYRNSVLVTLMSLPALYRFLEQYHGSAIECAHNCIGCALDNLRTLYWFKAGAYEGHGGEGGSRRWLIERAYRRSKQLKKCLKALDEYLEFADSVRVPGVCGVPPGDDIYGWKKLERGIEGLGPLAGRQNAFAYMEWMLESLMAQANEYGDGNTTPIEEIFYISLTNRSTRKTTHKASITIPFTTSDDISEPSIDSALDRILRENTTESLPHVLNVHIDRFKTDTDGKTTKNVNDISFNHVLDLTKYDPSDLYVLQSIILHGGPAEKGHWINITAGPRSRKWYLIDDGKVTEADLRVLLEELDNEAYGQARYVPAILTYVRAEREPPGIEPESQKGEGRTAKGTKRKSPIIAHFPSRKGKNE